MKKMRVLVVGVVLLVLSCWGIDVADPSFYWGEYAGKQCALAVKARGSPKELRGVCSLLQEVLEEYVEVCFSLLP